MYVLSLMFGKFWLRRQSALSSFYENATKQGIIHTYLDHTGSTEMRHIIPLVKTIKEGYKF